MPPFHGKDAQIFINAVDMTAYMREVSHTAEVDTADASTFADDDKVFIVGQGNATVSGEALLDATISDTLLPMLGSAARQIWQMYPAGAIEGRWGRGQSGDIDSVEVVSEIADVVKISIGSQSSVGADPIMCHHALTQRTAAGTAAHQDWGIVSTATGGYAYVNVTAISGSYTLKVQDSADNTTFTDLLTFPTISAPGGYRQEYTGTVRRYTRFLYTPTPTGTVTFVAGFGRNST